ncbi:5-oxoprolinase subunit PxpA [Ulvibacterium marinum]|uniref:5-oxoprolinase subunit PxpA n=1 Tax=Ulvibacterium marinum TaxID=2419782 RepID=A0A3B0C9U2_9FLAO|nr:5-oxoprolinase subunit PxpA [Ulvibacterium marinum]RKN81304.1 5-oxoprolinase subunit PxpA [Ulvibacterium marinum]
MDKIDINCDVGESMGNEEELFPFISSCNIACGGHAGNRQTMAEIVRLARQFEVKIGAHPSYPDKKNFGRISMDISNNLLIESIQEQIKSLTAILKMEKLDLHHVKLHGALYNDVAKNSNLAQTVLASLEIYKSKTPIYVPYASVMAKEAINQGFSVMYEAFGDRRYHKDLSLVSRDSPRAVIKDPKEVLQQVISVVKNKKVKTANGNSVNILADTVCIHGDNPFALQIVSYLSEELPNQNIQLKK